MHEIVLPETKPALEWINDRALQKVSPRREHALAQLRFATALDAWAANRGAGNVGTEWHFQVRPPGEIGRTLVPDVAYLSFERMSFEKQERTGIPHLAPDVVVEIRSPADLQVDIDEKVRVYLAAGTNVVVLVDPDQRSVIAVDRRATRVMSENDVIAHEMLPEFRLAARRLFETTRPKHR